MNRTMRWRRKTSARAKRPQADTSIALEVMEPRILLSADALGVDSGVTDHDTPDDQDWGIDRARDWWSGVDTNDANTDASGPVADSAGQSREIVFLDSGVDDGEQLLADLLADSDGRSVQVFVIDGSSDGVEQIGRVLAGQQDIDAVHILSHGSAGEIRLGDATLSAASLEGYAAALNDWGSGLGEHADILIYGCDLAADGQIGRAHV